ncbi:MAG: AraC family transcriptional regulator [Calditrichaceae bacterium]|nr:AraC family transcriptional regulator [Calditrichaceae bacterium]
MFATLVLLGRYSRNIKKIFSSVEKYQLNWLRNITLIISFVLCIFLLENILILIDINLSHFFSMTSYLAGFAIYLVGYLGLLKSEVFSSQDIISSFHQVMADNETGLEQEKTGKRQEKYIKSGLSPEKAKSYLYNLMNLMEAENLYTDSNLSLNQLADKLGVSAHNLSEVINTQRNQNFFDFINQYRIDRVKKDLTDPAKSNLKILSIAFDAGFNSKASFNTIFKKFTGLTPSDYRNKVSS